jgi:transcriptional regulator with XRE-family HTH domain
MTIEGVRALLRGRLDKGSQRTAAIALGVSQQYLSDVLTGARTPGPKILWALGLRRVMGYELLDVPKSRPRRRRKD